MGRMYAFSYVFSREICGTVTQKIHARISLPPARVPKALVLLGLPHKACVAQNTAPSPSATPEVWNAQSMQASAVPTQAPEAQLAAMDRTHEDKDDAVLTRDDTFI